MHGCRKNAKVDVMTSQGLCDDDRSGDGAVGVTDVRDTSREFKRLQRRRAVRSFNFWVGFSLIVALVVMANCLAARYYMRADWSRTQACTLSEKTRAILRGIRAPVQVLVFFQPTHEAFGRLRRLLKEYSHECELLHVEYVDPDRDLTRVKELALAYELGGANVVMFDCGGRRRYVKDTELLQVSYARAASSVQRGARRRATFRGEQMFSSALLGISRTNRVTACFVGGHGEKDIQSFDRYSGYSRIGKLIRLDNVRTHAGVLGEGTPAPGDCDVLVIAGPRRPFSEEEVEIVRRYLQRSGNLLLLVDPGMHTGLEGILEEWGVRIGGEEVIEPARASVLPAIRRGVAVHAYGEHAITRHLQGLVTKFHVPVALAPLGAGATRFDQADRPTVTVLAASSGEGWAESNPNQDPPQFDPAEDRKGPIPVALAVERGPVPGIDVQIKPMRMVVLGDSDLVSNNALSGGNADFFMSALNWLLERHDLVAIGPKVWEEYRFEMGKAQLYMIFIFAVLLLPASVAAIGAVVAWRRRA